MIKIIVFFCVINQLYNPIFFIFIIYYTATDAV